MPRPVSILVHLTLGVLCAVALGCGGGSDSEPLPTTVVATFTPATASPVANTVSLQPGNRSGDTFQVRVTATDVASFFGGSFTLTYDSTRARFVSWDTSGSFLRDGGISASSLQFLEDHTSVPGEVLVTATRLQNAGGNQAGVSVAGTRDLVVFTFRALGATSGSAFALAAPREVIDPAGDPITVTWSGGTLTAN